MTPLRQTTIHETTAMSANSNDCVEWGPNTPKWLRDAVGDDQAFRKAIDECLSEQGHPTDMDMFPAATAVISRTTPGEIDKLVAQGRV